MHAYKEPETIHIQTSPKRLRELADKMEKKWPTLMAGDSTFVGYLHCDRDLVIKLNIDQEAMSKG